MTRLVFESELNATLEGIIRDAREHLYFLCPYFKLHDRLKDCLKLRKEDPYLEITVIFGKNEEDPHKSLSRDDFEFLKSFPNIQIAYEKRLHAKYYANERSGLVTSLNLHTYSQNNNIEVGVFFSAKDLIQSTLNSLVSETKSLDTQASKFFEGVLENAEMIYESEPQFESKLLGLQKKFIGSKVLTNKTSIFFGNQYRSEYKSQDSKYFQSKHSTFTFLEERNQGYCIRSGIKIPFDPTKPLSWDCYQSWAQYSNPNWNENFCHACGKNWRTSVANPFCNSCQ